MCHLDVKFNSKELQLQFCVKLDLDYGNKVTNVVTQTDRVLERVFKLVQNKYN